MGFFILSGLGLYRVAPATIHTMRSSRRVFLINDSSPPQAGQDLTTQNPLSPDIALQQDLSTQNPLTPQQGSFTQDFLSPQLQQNPLSPDIVLQQDSPAQQVIDISGLDIIPQGQVETTYDEQQAQDVRIRDVVATSCDDRQAEDVRICDGVRVPYDRQAEDVRIHGGVRGIYDSQAEDVRICDGVRARRDNQAEDVKICNNIRGPREQQAQDVRIHTQIKGPRDCQIEDVRIQGGIRAPRDCQTEDVRIHTQVRAPREQQAKDVRIHTNIKGTHRERDVQDVRIHMGVRNPHNDRQAEDVRIQGVRHSSRQPVSQANVIVINPSERDDGVVGMTANYIETKSKIIDGIVVCDKRFYLLENGNIVTTAPRGQRNDPGQSQVFGQRQSSRQARIIHNTVEWEKKRSTSQLRERLKISRLGTFCGHLYGLSGGRMYVLNSDTLDDNEWKWIMIKDWPADVIDFSCTSDTLFMWLTCSNGGYQIEAGHKPRRVTKRSLIRRYARDCEKYIEFMPNGSIREYLKDSLVQEHSKVRDAIFDNNQRLHILSSTQSNYYFIRLMKTEIEKF